MKIVSYFLFWSFVYSFLRFSRVLVNVFLSQKFETNFTCPPTLKTRGMKILLFKIQNILTIKSVLLKIHPTFSFCLKPFVMMVTNFPFRVVKHF